ncbi:hypothetical protein G6F46_006608 [Rhizopus delemar]|uniref:Transmembrane protein n=2 Tax=Rhizopus TaxID=4842 RepID=A0A9P7CP55_9FUNG|nr:hypothetical protein G6F55_008835 [Rhizopus delemar]KAG1543364.1 hypothetical protein G6F51_006721 [Rhizopus arrhizus]KAG1520498.1 hypothetical protein G6F52_007604 [Rhizopus delemar]KAG1558643.1 hypothetical protein G6F49_004318 [Rhizopus delemar]KAG1569382.1 hypothetical protein G6F50_006424 [Rhizopus delemar]
MSSIETSKISSFMINNIDDFVADWHVRVTWIAFMTLWVFWGLVWVFRNFFVSNSPALTPAPEANAADDTEASKKKLFSVTSDSFALRLDRAHQVVKDALFSLLCLLSMNSFARASTRAVMILAWFFTAFAVCWFAVVFLVDNRFVRLTYSLVFYALGLAIAGLAFKQGFY